MWWRRSQSFGRRDTSSRFYRTAIATCSMPPGRTSAFASITSSRSKRPAISSRTGRPTPRPPRSSGRTPPAFCSSPITPSTASGRNPTACGRRSSTGASGRSAKPRIRPIWWWPISPNWPPSWREVVRPLAFARVHRHGAAMTIAASERDPAVVRHDWTRAEVRALFELPFPESIFRAQRIHRLHFDPAEVQISTLISIKTGGCPEDCAYCPQSAHYQTSVKAEKLMRVDAVVAEARAAQSAGASRFCMGAAWREPKDRDLDNVCEMVAGVKALGLETCATLGMLTQRQARRLKAAGLDYYNHNLDTSPEYYGAIITTRTYQDRLDTLGHVRDAGIHVCCGGIVGMGESAEDRVGMIVTLANLPAHPESVPINMLVKVEGTPLAHGEAIDPIDFVRTIAAARITMPRSVVRLSAGREDMSEETQALCFIAGANSIFYGPKLLTTPNPGRDRDLRLMDKLGLVPMSRS